MDADQCTLLPTAQQPPGQLRSFLCDVACSFVPDERHRYCYVVVVVVGTGDSGTKNTFLTPEGIALFLISSVQCKHFGMGTTCLFCPEACEHQEEETTCMFVMYADPRDFQDLPHSISAGMT